MISSCDQCGRILAKWRVRCPHCKKSAFNWLQLLAVFLLIVPKIFVVLRFM
jgi:RNA polymerase subunit RPABC4/transcription elongation factor Spt4